MKFGIKQLRTFIDTALSDEEIIIKLTKIGLEVESVTDVAKSLEPFVVAKVLECVKHKDSDKLNVCKVNDGSGNDLQVVCGACNVRAGLNVVFAPIGSLIPRDNLVIKKANIRGIESQGMICSASELCLGGDSDGIIELDDSFVVGSKYLPYLNLELKIIDVTITPNRGDCTSVYGIARGLAGYGYGKLTKPSFTTNHLQNAQILDGFIVKTPNCKTINLVKIKGTSNTQSPKWLTYALDIFGLESKNFIVDIANFILFTFGQPLHVFDAEKLGKNLELTNLTTDGEFYPISDNNATINIKEQSLVLKSQDQDAKIYALSGIMGGIECCVDSKTKDILIESAYFDPDIISLGSKLNNIASDSCYRFERGVNPCDTKVFLNIVIDYILKNCGGSVDAVFSYEDIDFVTSPKTCSASFDYFKNKLGVEIEQSDLIKKLESLDIKTKIEDKEYTFTMPIYRHDLTNKDDIAEELAISIGYDNIIASPININDKNDYAKDNKAKQDYEISQDIRKILTSMGIDENINYSFFRQSDYNQFNFYKESVKIDITNPINPELVTMRDSVVPCLLKNLSLNKRFGEESFKIFEIGTCFYSFDEQLTNVAMICGGLKQRKTALMPEKEYCIFDIKSYLVSLLQSVYGIKELSLKFKLLSEDSTSQSFNPFNSYKVMLGNVAIGCFGQVHPSYLNEALDVKKINVFFAEIYLKNLPSPKKSKQAYAERLLQNVNRDLSFVTDSSLEVGVIIKTVMKNKNIESVNVVDIFQDNAKIGDNKKSVSISLSIKQGQSTSTKEEIDTVIIADVVNQIVKLGCILRDGSLV
jgi:phenylalanyl-tRNA synthetase beta chain